MTQSDNTTADNNTSRQFNLKTDILLRGIAFETRSGYSKVDNSQHLYLAMAVLYPEKV